MLLDLDSVKFEVLRLYNDNVSFSKIQRLTGVERRQAAKFVRQESYLEWWAENQKPIAAGSYYDHHHTVKTLAGSRFIITSAQNNTYVHTKFLQSLETMADHLSAKIIVGTFSYNKNGFQNLEKSDADWFDPKITPYIIDEPVQLA